MAETEQATTTNSFAEILGCFHDIAIFSQKGSLSFDAVMILLWLSEESNSTAGKLTESMGISSSKTSRCLRELTSRGLISESVDSADARKCHFKISGKGSNVIYEMTNSVREQSPSELVSFYIALKKAARISEQIGGFKITDTAQKILLTLRRAGHPSTVSQLCALTYQPQSRTSMSLKKLKQIGLVAEDDRTSDLRMRSYRLTEVGILLADAMLVKLPL